MVTNNVELQSMIPVIQNEYKKVYENHPLKDYIDWDSFLNSTDGNEMHFLCAEKIFIDENDKTNIILESFSDENGLDYNKVYIVEDDSFYDIPVC